MTRKLDRIRFVTWHFNDLQGLRYWVPLGLITLSLGGGRSISTTRGSWPSAVPCSWEPSSWRLGLGDTTETSLARWSHSMFVPPGSSKPFPSTARPARRPASAGFNGCRR